MKLDEYTTKARIYPSIIIIIPFLLFTIYCDIDNLKDIFSNLLAVKIVGNITISIVLLFLFTQLNRFLGKFLFEKNMYNNELDMPTTKFLLFSNNILSKEYKMKLRKKILLDFEIHLPSKESEGKNLDKAKQQIVEAVGLIRQKVKDGRLLLQHNIEYGFARNLIGGSIIGVLMSIFNAIYFYGINNNLLVWISIFLAIIFSSLLLLHRVIINHLGNQYAQRLFQEYLEK